MKKKILLRAFLGFPIGVLIGYLITILGSFFWGNGTYMACHPVLLSTMGNEINAVILQSVLSGFLGASSAACSAVWEMERLNLAKQTIICFLILSAVMLPIAYLLHWMEHTLSGFASYYGIFTLIFIIIWVVQYLTRKYNVAQINANLDKIK